MALMKTLQLRSLKKIDSTMIIIASRRFTLSCVSSSNNYSLLFERSLTCPSRSLCTLPRVNTTSVLQGTKVQLISKNYLRTLNPQTSWWMMEATEGPGWTKRMMSGASPAGNVTGPPKEEAGPSPKESLSKRAMLKKAVKDYGATVIVFHVAISLASLGFFYTLVSSGLDPASWLKSMGVGESVLESKITQGASTFVVAYAVHKVFAPLRITITLTATPFIVRYLRGIGFLKKPVS